jgi:membrane protein required for colicin V production
MALDITALIILTLFFIRGYTRGIIVAVFSFIGIFLGIIVALKMSQAFSCWLLKMGFVSIGWAPIISYIVLFTGVVLLVRILARIGQKFVEGMFLGVVNKMAGGVLYMVLGCIFWSVVLWLGTQMHFFPNELIQASKSYNFLSQIAPFVFMQVGRAMPFLKDTFSNLQSFFNSIDTKTK